MSERPTVARDEILPDGRSIVLVGLMGGTLAQGAVQPVSWLLEQVRIGEAGSVEAQAERVLRRDLEALRA